MCHGTGVEEPHEGLLQPRTVEESHEDMEVPVPAEPECKPEVGMRARPASPPPEAGAPRGPVRRMHTWLPVSHAATACHAAHRWTSFAVTIGEVAAAAVCMYIQQRCASKVCCKAQIWLQVCYGVSQKILKVVKTLATMYGLETVIPKKRQEVRFEVAELKRQLQ